MSDNQLIPQSDEVAEKRRRLAKGKRDSTGFSVESLPFLTAQQTKWILARASVATNAEACHATKIPQADVLDWMENPDFVTLYQETLANKREGFKQLATQALPLVLEALLDMLQSKNDKARATAATLLLRNQGLLVDKVTTADPDAIRKLLEEVRAPRPIIKTLPNPKDYAQDS